MKGGGDMRRNSCLTFWTRLVRLAVVALVLAASAVACGGTGDAGGSAPVTKAPVTMAPTSTPSAPVPGTGGTPSVTATGQPASAADDLASFFAESGRTDLRIRTAATLVNGDVGTEGPIHFRPQTLAAMRAAWAPRALAQTIPAGLTPSLLRPVLLVYSDLVSRAASVSNAPNESERDYQLRCLGAGAPAAARFPGDLAALRAAAARAPAVVPAAPDSRAAAEILVRTAYINGYNAGCGGCGGQVFTDLTTIVWRTQVIAADEPPVDGTIGGVAFRASYQTGKGWQIVIMAC